MEASPPTPYEKAGACIAVSPQTIFILAPDDFTIHWLEWPLPELLDLPPLLHAVQYELQH